jgi:hypothetical protein
LISFPELKNGAALAAPFFSRCADARLRAQLRVILRLTIRDGRIAELQAIADAERLGQIHFTLFDQR